jgi:hypothetical protein
MFVPVIRSLLVPLVLVLSAAVLAPSPVAAEETSSSRTAARAETAQMRLGTYNILARARLDRFKSAIDRYKQMVDVAGLQEIGSNDRHRYLRKDRHWGYYRPPTLQQNPIIWRRGAFDFVSARPYKIADPAYIGNELGRGDQTYPRSLATIVRLVHRASGQQVSLINVHLISGTVKGGRPVKSRPRAHRLFTRQVAGTVRAIKDERAHSDRVYVLGDFNIGYVEDAKWRLRKHPFRRYTRIGLSSMWKGSRYLKTEFGTHNDSLIDGVWTTGRAAGTFISRKIRVSDHRAAVATYNLPVKDGYSPRQGSFGFDRPAMAARECDRPYQARDAFSLSLEGDMRYGYVEVDVQDGTAEEGSDFTVDVESLYDNDLENNHVDVYILPDDKNEGDESLTVRLVNPVNGRVTAGAEQASFTIVNDDPRDQAPCPAT